MRTITTALENAQKSEHVIPYIWVYLTSADGSTTRNYSSRLIQLEHVEEPYDDRATVILYNNDMGVANVLGYWLEIGYGCNCLAHGGKAQEYSSTPRLWVKSQHVLSREGDLFTVLSCEGMWRALNELDIITKGSPPFYTGQYTEETVYDIIEEILSIVEFDNGSFTLNALGSQDDGIINDFQPRLWINEVPFENPAIVLYRLIAMTKCYLRAKASLAFEIVYPQESDSVNETYYSNKAHYFHEYREKTNINVPNHIVVYANEDQDEGWSNVITAESLDQDSIDAYHDVTRHHIAGDVSTQTDAGNRASAILSKIIAETLAGKLIVPHDCRVELYDRVAIYDARKEA